MRIRHHQSNHTRPPRRLFFPRNELPSTGFPLRRRYVQLTAAKAQGNSGRPSETFSETKFKLG
jgi:hypothetical protein